MKFQNLHDKWNRFRYRTNRKIKQQKPVQKHTWCTPMRNTYWAQGEDKRKTRQTSKHRKKRSQGFLPGLFPSCHKRVYFTAVTGKHGRRSFKGCTCKSHGFKSPSFQPYRHSTYHSLCDRYWSLLALNAYLPSDHQHLLRDTRFLPSPSSSPDSFTSWSSLHEKTFLVSWEYTHYSLSFLKDCWAPTSTIPDVKKQREEERDHN